MHSTQSGAPQYFCRCEGNDGSGGKSSGTEPPPKKKQKKPLFFNACVLTVSDTCSGKVKNMGGKQRSTVDVSGVSSLSRLLHRLAHTPVVIPIAHSLQPACVTFLEGEGNGGRGVKYTVTERACVADDVGEIR